MDKNILFVTEAVGYEDVFLPDRSGTSHTALHNSYDDCGISLSSIKQTLINQLNGNQVQLAHNGMKVIL